MNKSRNPKIPNRSKLWGFMRIFKTDFFSFLVGPLQSRLNLTRNKRGDKTAWVVIGLILALIILVLYTSLLSRGFAGGAQITDCEANKGIERTVCLHGEYVGPFATAEKDRLCCIDPTKEAAVQGNNVGASNIEEFVMTIYDNPDFLNDPITMSGEAYSKIKAKVEPYEFYVSAAGPNNNEDVGVCVVSIMYKDPDTGGKKVLTYGNQEVREYISKDDCLPTADPNRRKLVFSSVADDFADRSRYPEFYLEFIVFDPEHGTDANTFDRSAAWGGDWNGEYSKVFIVEDINNCADADAVLNTEGLCSFYDSCVYCPANGGTCLDGSGDKNQACVDKCEGSKDYVYSQTTGTCVESTI